MVERKEIIVPEIGNVDDYFEYLVIKMYVERGDKLTEETLKK